MITILIIIGLIVVVLLLAMLFIGTKFYTEHHVTINRSPQQVFDYIKFTNNHDRFSVWNMADPEMKKENRGIDGTEGFVYAWDSSKNKNVGAGEQETKKIVEGQRIEYEIRFKRPMQSNAKSWFRLAPIEDNKTDVAWGFANHMKMPMNLMKPVFQKMVSKDLKKGLQNLKTIMETH
jgi:uncharacterized protein YndB with AHSA1/START domain